MASHQPSEAPDEVLPGRAGPRPGLRHDEGQVPLVKSHRRRVFDRTLGTAHPLFNRHEPNPPDTAKEPHAIAPAVRVTAMVPDFLGFVIPSFEDPY